MSAMELMLAPFAECLILVAIHTYLGIHVLKRRVIFVDLALAQIAALGTTVGFLFGIMPDTPAALAFSMVFTFLGAAVFAVTRFRHERIPQEAIIGLTYAIACAVAVMVVEKTRGAEHLKDILVGNLLWVTWADVGAAAAVYLAVGVVHFAFRRQFLAISENADKAYALGLPVRAWDFLFYLTFGVVITFSTRVAGVLLVFVFLVAPAILALLMTERLVVQLLIGWGTGTVVTVAGLYLSWVLDLPSGPAVIAFYGVALVAAAVIVFLARSSDHWWAARRALLGAGLTALAVAAVCGLGAGLARTSLAVSDEAREAATQVSRSADAATSREAQALESHRQLLESRAARCVGGNKIDRHLSFAGPEEQMQHARHILEDDRRRGLEFVFLILADDAVPLLYREEALALLEETLQGRFGYDAALQPIENTAALERLCGRLKRMKQAGRGEGAPRPISREAARWP
jgi:zinc/manganese transport system permease protein